MTNNSKPNLLLYIHGFNSSPLSYKAQALTAYCKEYHPDILCVTPRLPSYPADVALFLETLIEQYQQKYNIALVGSSLGGYFSTWLNDKYGFRAVLINPAVKPYVLLADYLGSQVNPYTNEAYHLEEKHMDELLALNVEHLKTPECFWLLQQKGDEVLHYQEAVDKYAQCQQVVEEGGDHSFVGFERYLEDIVQFLYFS